jgi:hypothetical protein
MRVHEKRRGIGQDQHLAFAPVGLEDGSIGTR